MGEEREAGTVTKAGTGTTTKTGTAEGRQRPRGRGRRRRRERQRDENEHEDETARSRTIRSSPSDGPRRVPWEEFAAGESGELNSGRFERPEWAPAYKGKIPLLQSGRPAQ